MQLGRRDLFPSLAAHAYLNHAAISPPSTPVAAAARRVIDDYARLGVGAVFPWMEQRERLRAKVATFLGARPADIGFPPGTTRGIVDLALAIPLAAGDRVLCFEGEFPSNVTPWMTAARLAGARVDLLPVDGFGDGSGAGLARVESALRAGSVRLIAVSAVQFQTGLAMPLAALASLAHGHGAELFVDGIQALGGQPLDVGALGVDYLVAGTHKWLMGLDGLAIAYASPAARARLQPKTAGWLSHEQGLTFLFEGEGHLRYDRPLRTELGWMEGGVQATPPFAALEASLDILASIGLPAIAEHIQRYHDALEPRLLALGLESARASDPAARSGILSVRPGPRDLAALGHALGERGVAVSTPDGWLRFAPHWPNALDEVDRVAEAVADVL
ncbi:MAG: cysteine desulfurase/selenocysteine lyase [Myxococcota bacterium]